MTTVLEPDTEDLAKRFRHTTARTIVPTDDGYDDVRQVHNGMIDKRPGLIVQCHGVSDIVAAVRFAREYEAEISVRGGGHNVAGTAVTEGGVMIDLSPMRAIHVDPNSSTARAQGGATWAEMNQETQLHGLAVTGGIISSTGIAGLTLGGGIGWMMGKYGMAVDDLRSAQVVTATGDVVTASADSNPDLFWALRGGGGNFGVVPWFEYDLHQVGPMIVGGVIAHPVTAGADLLKFYRDYAWNGPDERSVVAGFLPAPDGSGHRVAAGLTCHLGSREQAELDLAPLRRFGTPIMDAIQPMPYSVMNSMLDAGFPKGARYYWKSAMLGELPDEAIDIIVERYEKCPSKGSGILIEHFHGAVTRVATDATAFPHRDQAFNLVVASAWGNPEATEDNVAWTRETFAALAPFVMKRHYGNYLGTDDQGVDSAKAAYGANYERLRDAKRTWDPDNVFHLNVNVAP